MDGGGGLPPFSESCGIEKTDHIDSIPPPGLPEPFFCQVEMESFQEVSFDLLREVALT